jgi:nitroimidazol reductase NimA-like FMN-containing flavoprotein (pyridoxamine 5'-phosphate oxidase superfamily)
MNADRYELTTRDSIDLLRTASIGRLCIVEHDFPVAIPVNYRLVGADGDARVVVRVAPDSMLARFSGNASLEVDDIQLERGVAWSVIVRGVFVAEPDPSGLADPRPMIAANRRQWMSLGHLIISGRRFVIHPADDGYSVDWQSTA